MLLGGQLVFQEFALSFIPHVVLRDVAIVSLLAGQPDDILE
jgi:hypothetical protein